MSKRPSVPSYHLHKQSGQAVVTLTDGFGGRRDVLLGSYGSAASRKEYDRVIAEWIGNGRRLRASVASDLSVNELAWAYWNHAKAYHGWNKHDGYNLKDVLRIVRTLYGHAPAREFGPIALKACRQKMLEMDWSRNYINRQVARICQMFKWAASEEMLPASVPDQFAGLPCPFFTEVAEEVIGIMSEVIKTVEQVEADGKWVSGPHSGRAKDTLK
jgi:hypothetical protein